MEGKATLTIVLSMRTMNTLVQQMASMPRRRRRDMVQGIGPARRGPIDDWWLILEHIRVSRYRDEVSLVDRRASARPKSLKGSRHCSRLTSSCGSPYDRTPPPT